VSETLENWLIAKLADISKIEMGQSPDSRTYNDKGDGLPFFQGKAEFGKLYPTVRKWCTEPTKIAEAGDILLSVRAPVGPTNLAAEKCCIGRGLAAIRAEEPINQKYLLHHFRNIEPWLNQQGTGTTFAAISGDFIRQLKVPVAPLNEQKRIADKLDSLLAQVGKCQEHLDRVPQLLKRFRQSVLTLAISGAITQEWRVATKIESWTFERAESICNTVQSGGTPRQGFIDKAGIPFLKIYNIVDQKINFDYRPQYITEEIHNGSLSRSQTKPGDVLFNIVGPPLGKVAIVTNEFPEWNINQAITLFRPSERILTEWIYYFLCSGFSVNEIIHETRGSAGQINISLSQCRNLIFPVPPLAEQYEIVRRVRNLFEKADNIEARWNTAQAHILKLTPSVLAKAFRGELVEQDPNDEPAFALLERIQAQRAVQPAKAKREPKSKKTRETKMTKDTVKEVILSLPNEKFSFDELREKFPGDYERLKIFLFDLLDEPEPAITQVFDQSAKAMRFVRRSK